MAEGWDGTVLDRQEMPLDVAGGALDAAERPTAPEERTCKDNQCVGTFEKCGGGYNTSSLCCDPAAECVVKNWFYAQCLPDSHQSAGASSLIFGNLFYCADFFQSRANRNTVAL